MKNELAFANKEAAFKVAELLLEECYVVMISREEEFYILNYEYSEHCDRNDVVFMQAEDYDQKLMDIYKEAQMDALHVTDLTGYEKMIFSKEEVSDGEEG